MKTIKSDSDSDSDEQKGRQVFQEKNRGVTLTPSVAAPGVTHPSDATDGFLIIGNFTTRMIEWIGNTREDKEFR